MYELLDVVLIPLQRLVEPPEWWLLPAIAASHGASADDSTATTTAAAAAAAPAAPAAPPRLPSARARAAWAGECELALQCVTLCMNFRAAATAASVSAAPLRTACMIEWVQRCMMLQSGCRLACAWCGVWRA